jgi:hypothetical protein
MPHDRRTGRFVLAMMGLVGVAVSVGCLRSSNLRSSAGSIPELSPVGDLQSAPVGSASGTGSPSPSKAAAPSGGAAIATPTRPTPDPGPTPEGPAGNPAPGARTPADTSVPDVPSSPSPAPVDERPAPTPALPTPLLDAEIRRAQAVNRQHIESLRAADATAPVVPPVAAPPDRPSTTPEPAASAASKPVDLDVVPPLPPLAATPRAASHSEAEAPTVEIVVPPFAPIDAPGVVTAPTTVPVPAPAIQPTGDSQPPTKRSVVIADAHEDDVSREESTPSPAGSSLVDDPKVVVRESSRIPPESAAPAAHPPLAIAELRLCSQVEDFGSIKPVDAGSLKPGQRVLVYYEMTGVEYRPQGDLFVSRLAAHFELRSVADGAVVWEQTPGTALYRCRRPRRDYYASFRAEFPGALPPGPYRLRLIQTDLIADRAASREIPITIVR